jgi:hypothetical protein
MVIDEFNETVVQREQLEYGTMPEYKGESLDYEDTWQMYRHTGWNPAIHSVTGDETYVAIFSTTPLYTVRFYDCNGVTILKTEKVEPGQDAVAPTASQQDGSIISGWDKEFTNVQNNLNVYAECTLESYTVTLVAENGVIAVTDEQGEEVDLSQPIAYGTMLTLVATGNEGFVFDRWSDELNENTRHITVTSDLTLTAFFKARTFEVTFVDWDDSVLKEAQTVNYGDAAIAPADPTREGYKFIGWDKDFSAVKEDMTVKAQYEQLIEGFENIVTGENAAKLLRDGQILILRGEKTYTMTGQEVK